VADRRTAVDRISADLDRVSGTLAPLAGPSVPEEVDRATQNALVDDLAQAAGIPAIADEVHDSYVWRARRLTGWPFARLVGNFLPDPRSAAEKELGGGRAGASGGFVTPRAIGRAEVDGALRTLADRLTSTIPTPWHTTVAKATRTHAADVQPALDRVLSETDLGLDQKPGWWRVMWVVQWILAIATIAGAVGTILSAVRVLPIGLLAPLGLFGGGLVLGLLLALVSRSLVSTGARRAQARVSLRLRDGIVATVREFVLGPIRAELTAYATAQDAYQVLRNR
jgi:hypothetical protein